MEMDTLHERARRGDEDALKDAISRIPLAMVLTDPRQDDNPITYVNDAFERVTLYSRSFAVGRNCRFLQGEETAKDTVERLRKGVAERSDVMLDITNHKADGTPFRNRLMISPIKNAQDEVVAFLGVQKELGRTERSTALQSRSAQDRPDEDVMLAEVQHRVKNHLAMVVSMIRLQAGKQVTRKSFEALSNRVESLALLYDELSAGGLSGSRDATVPAGAYLSRIGSTLNAIDGRGSVRVNIDCDDVDVPVDTAARLGLLLTEFVTNALEHAFEGRDEGVIRIRFQAVSDGGVRLMVEDDGVGLPEGSNWPWGPGGRGDAARREDGDGAEDGANAVREGGSGLGGRLIASLARSIGAHLDVRSSRHGTIVSLDLELD